MKVDLLTQILAAGLPRPLPEHEFHPHRNWRLDYAWPDRRLAVEVDGGIWTGGRHTRGRGYQDDCTKLNAALLLGWRVLRFTTAQVASGEALSLIHAALEGREYA